MIFLYFSVFVEFIWFCMVCIDFNVLVVGFEKWKVRNKVMEE